MRNWTVVMMTHEFCVICNILMNYEHLYVCGKLREDNLTNIPEYSKIFTGNIWEQKTIVNILENNLKTDNDLTQ